MKLSKYLIILFLVSLSGCATLKEIAQENPVLTYIVVSNGVSQRIKHADDQTAKAEFYMGLVAALKGAGGGSIPYASAGDIIRSKVGYAEMHPADKKAIDDLLFLSKLAIEKELAKRGIKEIPDNFSIDLTVYLDAIEAGARVYLPN